LNISGLKRNWKNRARKKPLWRMALLGIVILLSAAPAQADKAADRKLRFFRGTTPQTSAIELGWPVVELTRDEESDYPFQRVKTVAGTLLVRGYNFYGEQQLFLDDKKLTTGIVIEPIIAYPEQEKNKPAVIIYKFLKEEDLAKHQRDTAPIRIIDMGVSPPFISKDYLRIDFPFQKEGKEERCFQSLDCRPTAYADAIKKLDADTYLISGLSPEEKDPAGNPLSVSYRYSRKDGTVTRVK